MSDPTADVVVIGAGVIGSCIAWRLSQIGMKVIVIDSAAPGAGASGSCDKAIFLQSKRPGLPMRMAVESRSMYSTLTDELDADIEFSPGGGMVAIETDTQMTFMKSFVEEQRQAGITVELLDGDQARAHQPGLSEHILGASYSPDDAEVNPLSLNAALVDAAVRAGAEIRRQHEFLDVVRRGSQVEAVVTSKDRIPTRLASPAWSGLVPESAHRSCLDEAQYSSRRHIRRSSTAICSAPSTSRLSILLMCPEPKRRPMGSACHSAKPRPALF